MKNKTVEYDVMQPQKEEVDVVMKELEKTGRMECMKQCIQHGDISVYEHCVRVAVMSLVIAELFKITVDRRSLIVGALLHDYFLYDWHEKDDSHKWHGFFHPSRALENANEDYELNERQKNIILRHMFPLTPVPPVCREAWIVCLADKVCATEETIKPLQLNLIRFLISRRLFRMFYLR